ncbi:hypothetical protein [Azospirillum doebereinerae]
MPKAVPSSGEGRAASYARAQADWQRDTSSRLGCAGRTDDLNPGPTAVLEGKE